MAMSTSGDEGESPATSGVSSLRFKWEAMSGGSPPARPSSNSNGSIGRSAGRRVFSNGPSKTADIPEEDQPQTETIPATSTELSPSGDMRATHWNSKRRPPPPPPRVKSQEILQANENETVHDKFDGLPTIKLTPVAVSMPIGPANSKIPPPVPQRQLNRSPSPSSSFLSRTTTAPPLPARRQTEQIEPVSLESQTTAKLIVGSYADLQRPPPRHASLLSRRPSTSSDAPSAQSLATLRPPPIPTATRPIISTASLSGSSSASLAPSSPSSLPANQSHSNSAQSILPPPPVRTVALGIIPPRRQASQSPTASSPDEKYPSSMQLRVCFPDTHQIFRRSPTLTSNPPIASPFPSGTPVITRIKHGILVVASTLYSEIKVINWPSRAHTETYDFSPIVGEKKMGITAMEWFSSPELPNKGSSTDEVHGIWVGTTCGTLHFLSLGLTDCIQVLESRTGWHNHPIHTLSAWGHKVVSVDDSGKCIVFVSGASDGASLKPLATLRLDRPSFVAIFAGSLWTAGIGSNCVKVYDLEQPSNRPAILTIPSDAGTGSPAYVTFLPACSKCCARPTNKNSRYLAYIGTERGTVTTWCESSELAEGGWHCISMAKLGSGDPVSIVGVPNLSIGSGGSIWMGGRDGSVGVWEVSPRCQCSSGSSSYEETSEWTLKALYQAHDSSVYWLGLDGTCMSPLGQLPKEIVVVSVGRDDYLKFWDGLRASQWIDSTLSMAQYSAVHSSFQPLQIRICTWNVDASRPEQLSSSSSTCNREFLAQVIGGHVDQDPVTSELTKGKPADVLVFGFQEVIDLENKKLTAKTVLLGSRHKKDNQTATPSQSSPATQQISEKITRAYKQWHDALVLAVRLTMPPEDPYIVIHTENLVGLFTCIFVRASERSRISNVAVARIKRGMGGFYGNKGAIVARFVIDDTSLAFVNCHLAAGQNHRKERGEDLAAIFDEKNIFPSVDNDEMLAFAGGGGGSMIVDHEICFLNGDLNYRIDHPRTSVLASIETRNYTSLLTHDQLRRELHGNATFRLRAFQEAPISFAPTYKYDRGSSIYDTSEKSRTPAWCDRILWRSRDDGRGYGRKNVECLGYSRHEVNVSDHRPVVGSFKILIKKVNRELREETKRSVEELWVSESKDVLKRATEFWMLQRSAGLE